jgi:predicted nucleotidyltransferase
MSYVNLPSDLKTRHRLSFMRVSKTDVIAGLPAELARAIVRRFRGRQLPAEAVADLLEGTEHDLGTVFASLEAEGYMEKSDIDGDGDSWWDTTIQGNSLAMASFGKPISRKTANRLVAELLQRARAYNMDPSKPMFVDKLRVFGSYLDPEKDPIGDVDVELTYGRRITDQQALRDYTRASGRSFGTYVDQVLWPQTELFLHLKKRSAYINITLEDVSLLTETYETIYSIDDDPQAVTPPSDRQLNRV